MSKLTNLKGRIDYISSHARQENLYAVYKTTEAKFWNELAKCNQEEFVKSGTAGKCIEARELIIALPESFVSYDSDALLKLFTERFKQKYGTECISALHHNKRKTNYHIHLIFSERKLLEEPIVKIATRNMFYDENGKHVRTKKEILGEEGQVRKNCKIISKGEVFEQKLFTTKDSRFKSEGFLDEVKRSYTDLINIFVKNDKEKLKVFEKNGVYLSMKKVGKNNPKAEQIEEDNQMRKNWNQTVDRALVSGVTETQISEVKRKEISKKAKDSIDEQGKQPDMFLKLIVMAILAIEILITQILRLAYQNTKRDESVLDVVSESTVSLEPKQAVVQGKFVKNVADSVVEIEQKEILSEAPVKSILAAKYPRLNDIYQKLENQNIAIYQREQELSKLKEELDNTAKGIFKGKQRKVLQGQIEQLKSQIDNMKYYLSNIIKEYGYKNVKEFIDEYTVAKSEYSDYNKAVYDWKIRTDNKMESDSIKAKLEYYNQKVKKQEDNKPYTYSYSRKTGAR